LRSTEDIINAYKTLIKNKGDVLVSVTKSKKNPYFNMVEIIKKKVKMVKIIKKRIFRRQDSPATYDMNASIYIWNRNDLINSKSVILEKATTNKTVFYEMPGIRSIDIDSKLDFEIVEFLLKKRKII